MRINVCWMQAHSKRKERWGRWHNLSHGKVETRRLVSQNAGPLKSVSFLLSPYSVDIAYPEKQLSTSAPRQPPIQENKGKLQLGQSQCTFPGCEHTFAVLGGSKHTFSMVPAMQDRRLGTCQQTLAAAAAARVLQGCVSYQSNKVNKYLLCHTSCCAESAFP